MTSAEKRKILEEAIDRGYEEIANTNGHGMSQESFSTLIENTRDLEWWAHKEKYEDDPYPYDAGTDSPAPEKPQNQMPDPEPAAEDKIPEPTPEPTLTKDEVKAKLLALSDQYDELDVSVVMESMGYSKLSDIPADKYSLLLNKVAEVVKELA